MKPLIFMSLFFATVFAHAEIYSWQKCVDLAAAQNADLKTAQGQLKSRKSLEGSARAGFLPSVTGTLSAERQGSTNAASDQIVNVNAGTTFATSSTQDSYVAQIAATENLFNGLADAGKLNQAKANTRASQSALQASLSQLNYDLKSSYQGYLYAIDNIKLSQEIVKRREDNMHLVQLHFENGLENKGSVLLSQAYYADAKFGLAQAQHQRDVARAQLAHVLGFDDKQSLEVQEPVPVVEPPNDVPDLRSIAGLTPTHVQALATLDASRAAVTVARSGLLPSLNLTGAAGRTDDHFFPRNDNWSLGLTLTLPFFDGAASWYNTSSAKATVFANEEALTSADQKLLATLRSAFTNWIEAVEQLKVATSYRDAAVSRAEIARNKYNNGLLTFDAWDIIENDLIAREKSYIQSVRDRVTAEAAWEQAQGKGVFQ